MFRAIRFSLLFILVFVFTGVAQDLSGTWEGIFRMNGPSGTVRINFSKTDENWKGEAVMNANGREQKGQISEVEILEDSAKFTLLMEAQIKFAGTLQGGKWPGSFEVFYQGQKINGGVFCISKDKQLPCTEADLPTASAPPVPTQRADPDYDTKIADPAYTKTHPKILFDEAHQNVNTTTGRYKPFAELMINDGYLVTPNKQRFSAEVLKGYDILVISNARGNAVNESAFTDEEIEAVSTWIKAGGSLLLIADHAPAGGYSAKLSNRLGVEMSTGVTKDTANIDQEYGNLLFSAENNLLVKHPITEGRNNSEKVNRIVSFTGQSLSVPKEGIPILKLGNTAYDEFPNLNKKVSAAGRAQAVALIFGKGRVVVMGEAAMLTAQLSPNGGRFGMNLKGLDNRQFALNIMHWLSGLLK